MCGRPSQRGSKWPSGALAPRGGPDATYSGILECPLTTRIRKHLTGGGWNDSFATNIACNQKAPICPKTLDTAELCFMAAKNIGISPSTQRQANSQWEVEGEGKNRIVESVHGMVL
eukprot:gene17785-biopygen2808